MNSNRFDSVARQCAALGHRRTLLKAVLALIALTVGRRVPAAAGQVACPGGSAENQLCNDSGCVTPCASRRDCRSKHDDPCVRNTCVEGYCSSIIIECLPGSQCYRGECYATSCVEDADCTVFDPCRWGSCGVGGRCEFTEIDPCAVCASHDDCAGNGPDTICCGSTCRGPCPAGTAMGKGCECQTTGVVSLDGVLVLDDASG